MSSVRTVLAALWLPLVSSCISLTELPRALLPQEGGLIRAQALPCSRQAATLIEDADMASAKALDPESIRLITWNIHKEDDAGWDRDLRTFIASYDIVLLQEAVLQEPLRRLIEEASLQWVMASSFIYRGTDIGVLTAGRIEPFANCTERAVEPLIRIPKSAVISWFHLKGSPAALAVVNVHAINFSLSVEGYRAQFAALAEALASHKGPIIFGGDLNTWTDARIEVVEEVAKRLDLTEIAFKVDKRTLFFGKQLDHLFVRGLDVIDAEAIEVTSSDHNPVAATLRIKRQ